MPCRALYDVPPLYDRVVPPGPCQGFYGNLADKTGGPILELACGTGRLTIPLALTGHEIVGRDASAAMLRAARAKARAADVDVPFVRGDMRDFELGRRFALIIVSCNSLAHLTTHEDLRRCLTRIREHLMHGGLLAFDIVNPNIGALARSQSECVRIDAGPNPSSAIAVEEVASYDPIQQIRVAQWRVREPGIRIRELAPMSLRLFFPQEVPLLPETAGLELACRYGDFDGGPLAGESLIQVCVARHKEPKRVA